MASPDIAADSLVYEGTPVAMLDPSIRRMVHSALLHNALTERTAIVGVRAFAELDLASVGAGER